MRAQRTQAGYVRRMLGLAALAGLPAAGLALGWIWLGQAFPDAQRALQTNPRLQILATAGLLGFWALALAVFRRRLVRPLQTLANVLSGLREGDYSFQARAGAPGDPLGEAFLEVNTLVATMREQRLGALEATALLRTVMAEIDVAVFAFDDRRRLRLVNRAGERVLAAPGERLQGRTAGELGLGACLEGETPRTFQATFPGGAGRWGLHRRQFRGGGLPHTLLVISDLSRELREEERQAWQRLVRVLGHELNNSLAPVKSIAGSLESLLQREPLPEDWRQDMRDGLAIVSARAESLNRFVGAYARLARLPPPKCHSVDVPALLARLASLETRVPVTVLPGPPLVLSADPDQLEQLVINLVRNGADAVLEGRAAGGAAAAAPSAGVALSWVRSAAAVEIRVRDDGPGLANTANLFVPFFTTKPKGSGIGLVLCRQIAEGHGGSLVLENRADAPGCLARLRLPPPGANP